jgi:hypothetical protein
MAIRQLTGASRDIRGKAQRDAGFLSELTADGFGKACLDKATKLVDDLTA